MQLPAHKALDGLGRRGREQRPILGRAHAEVIGLEQAQPRGHGQGLGRLLRALHAQERATAQDTGERTFCILYLSRLIAVIFLLSRVESPLEYPVICFYK